MGNNVSNNSMIRLGPQKSGGPGSPGFLRKLKTKTLNGLNGGRKSSLGSNSTSHSRRSSNDTLSDFSTSNNSNTDAFNRHRAKTLDNLNASFATADISSHRREDTKSSLANTNSNNKSNKSASPPSESRLFFNENNENNNPILRNSSKSFLHHNVPRSMALKPKTNPIYEDYIISKQVLGLGISGKVLCCVNKQTKVKYALKTLRESVKAKREIDLHWRACQNCPYIVQIVDVYENTINTQKVILVVMECMEGGELFAKISERTKPFTEQEVAKIMYQICSAVRHLHSMSIAHRDLKPENLLLTSNEEDATIKLTDFGFAKEVNHGLVTPCYTPYYVAPEVLGSERYDISCDIWSLGVIMYILCCGYPPFYSTHGQPISPGMKRRIKAGEYTFPEAEWSRVSQEAKDLISRMLDTVPENRSTIEQIMQSHWISSYFEVPATPLPTAEYLKEDKEMLTEIQQNMGIALGEMRVNWDSKVKIKELNIVNNPLFERRMKKTKGDEPGTSSGAGAASSMMPPPSSTGFGEPMIVEEYSREQSMITPTNSRPASPHRK